MQISFKGKTWRKKFVMDMIKRLGIISPAVDFDMAEIIVVCEDIEDAEIDKLINLAKNGTRIVFLQPHAKLAELFGRELMYNYHFPLMQMNCDEIPVTFLQVFPPVILIKQKYGESLGFFAFDFSASGENYTTKYPAIVWRDYGSGRIWLFLYDFVATMLLLLQGWEFFTTEGGLTPASRTGIARAMHLADHLINRALASLPQAYFHELLFLLSMRKMAEPEDPLPRIWYYPYPDTTVLLLSGDSDGLDKKLLEKAYNILLKENLPYTQYIMIEDLKKFSSRELSCLSRYRIDFGLHYYAGPCPSEQEMLQHLMQARKIFISKNLECNSCRGHSCIWVGWDTHIKIMQKAGISYSSNLLHWYPGVTYGFPYHLYTREGKSRIQELQIMCSDDTMLFNKTGFPNIKPSVFARKLVAAMDVDNDLYYQPVNPIFHPVYLIKQPSTIEVLLESVYFARSKNIPVMNHKIFLNWWEKRKNFVLNYRISGKFIDFSLTDDEIAIALPVATKLKNMSQVKILKGSNEYIFPLKRRRYERQ